MVKEYVDLSRVLTPGIGQIPGHPPIIIEEFQNHITHDRSNACISYSIHCGTHVDCPYHFFPNGARVDEMPVEKFIGKGILVDLQGKVANGEPININQITNNSEIEKLTDEQLAQSIVLIRTGWSAKYETAEYYLDNPYLSEECAKFFAQKKVKAVGLDFPPDRSQGSIVHRVLLGSDVLIIENLFNLNMLENNTEFEVMALPIKFYRQGGGPARVLAILGEKNDN